MRSDLLAWMVFYPIIAGVLCLALPDKLKNAARGTALLTAFASLATSVFAFLHKEAYCRISPNAVFSIDNLSGFVNIGVSLFAFLITVYSLGCIKKSVCGYFGYILITLGSASGVVLAKNFIVLLTFWGMVAVMLYLLVNLNNTSAASGSAKKALIIIGGTDAFLILGIALLWTVTGSFTIFAAHIPLKGVYLHAAYFAIMAACLAKAGAVPFHSWLPDVAEDGPVPVTAYLPASLDKLLGIYLLARVSIDIFKPSPIANLVLLSIGSVTIIIGVMVALVQHDLKRLLGYHAVSQVGYMIIGIGVGNPIGMAGALFHMFNNAIYKSCLFLGGGNVEERTGTSDLTEMGGVARFMPVTFMSFLIASLSISGIPPFNGFVSKWLVYQGILESARPGQALWVLWITCAMFGSALTIASFLKLLHAVFLGRPDMDFAGIREAGFTMSFPVVTLAAICVIFGVLAFTVPLPMLVFPCLEGTVKFMGTWKPIAASTLLFIGILSGFLAYIVFGRKSFRTVPAFIGGEEAGSLERLSGADFYNTVRDMKALKSVYKKESLGELDMYNSARRLADRFTGFLQYLHNGRLPTFMVWSMLGMAGALLILVLR